jgi:hypothetical protein
VVSFSLWQTLTLYWHGLLRRRLRKAVLRHEKAHGRAEVALVLSVLTDITAGVRAHLSQAQLDGIPLLHVHQTEAFGEDPGAWLGYLERVKKEIRKIREMGISRVHVFSNGPVALALMCGATLTNGPEAVVYHHSGGLYREVGRVSFEIIRL